MTLSFQNIAVREALNVIADFTNLNMVISDSVSGNLTLRLKDVPWDQALQIILDSRGLDMRKNGNVIQVAPREELAAKEKLNLAANQEIFDLEALHTESFPLAYSKGAEIVALLQSPTQRMLSKRGSAVVGCTYQYCIRSRYAIASGGSTQADQASRRGGAPSDD